MKLLLAASLYPPETRGPAIFAGQLVEHLEERGARVEVVKFRDVRALPPVARHFMYFFKLLVNGWKSDVVLALDPVSVGLPALFTSWLLGAKFVLRAGGDYAWEQGVQRYGVSELLDEFVKKDKSSYPRRLEFLWKLQCFVAQRADALVVPSEYLKSIALAWGADVKRISVVSSVAKEASLSLEKRDTRQRVGWGREAVVFSIGQLVPWKGFPALIEAAGSLRREFPGIRLIIAGGGDQRTLRAQAQAAGFDPQTVFLGELPNVILRDLVGAADVFALNTAYEGLSHALVEVMHAGVPIVTTPVGGNPELIEDHRTGLLVPFNDEPALAAAIRELLKNKSLALKLAAAAKAKVAGFTPKVSMQKWETLLKTVCKS